jgi:hypothetical protein
MSALYLGLCFSSSHKKEMSSFLGLGSSRSRHSGCFYGCTHLGVFQNSVSHGAIGGYLVNWVYCVIWKFLMEIALLFSLISVPIGFHLRWFYVNCLCSLLGRMFCYCVAL